MMSKTSSIWSSTIFRAPGRISQIALFVILVTILASFAVLSKLSNAPALPGLCNPSGRLPGRFRGYLCSGNSFSFNIFDSKDHLFGEASSVHVIHLARRRDRFESMERLRSFFGVRWVYEDALEKTDDIVDAILDSVRVQRSKLVQFEWPSSTDEEALSSSALNTTTPLRSFSNSSDTLLCAIGDNDIPVYENSSLVPFHMVLSRGMVACWYSHLQVLQKVVRDSTSKTSDGDLHDREGITVIFEDDIDMESDIKRRMEDMWMDLPLDWDMLFLGASSLT